MFDSLPTASYDLTNALAALLTHPEIQDGIADGHTAFFDEYDGSDESWSVNELTELVDNSTLVRSHLEKSIPQAYLLEAWTQGRDVKGIRLSEVYQHRERLGQDMFYYGLGFLLGFIDQGLRPDENLS